jgi:16S rRNA processing protein RimM
MGRVAAPYGVRGWMKVQPFTDATDALLDYPEWWIASDAKSGPAARRVVEGRAHSGGLVVKLEGVETREAAARFSGREVSVPRDALPPEADDEVYVGDLVGLDVVNRNGQALGRVQDVSASGAQPIMRVVATDGGERLIPFVAALVDEVDLLSSRIVVDWEIDY